MLRAIEGHFVSGYADGGDAPDKQLELVPGAVEDAERVPRGAPRHARSRSIASPTLVEGFETPFGLELLVDRPLGRDARAGRQPVTRSIAGLRVGRAQEAVFAASDRARAGCADEEGLGVEEPGAAGA